MPTNLPPEAQEAERRYKAAVSTAEKVRTLEEFLKLIPKHKGTDKLRAGLRRRLSKLKSAAQTKKKTGKHESAYNIDREGAGRAVFVGVANTGKSSLLGALTNAEPDVSPSPYTTWSPTPGMMMVDDVQIQLIDTPPLNPDYPQPEMMEFIRQADILLLVVDLRRDPISQLKDTVAMLRGRRIEPEFACAGGDSPPSPIIIPALVIVNRSDDESYDEDYEIVCELLEHPCPTLAVSATTGRNLDLLKKQIYDMFGIIRVYSKPPGYEPNLDAPFVMPKGGTVEEFAYAVHQDFGTQLKSARVWGKGVFDGQMVGRDHVLHDLDIVELRI